MASNRKPAIRENNGGRVVVRQDLEDEHYETANKIRKTGFFLAKSCGHYGFISRCR